MSKDNAGSGQPDSGRRENPLPEDAPRKKRSIPLVPVTEDVNDDGDSTSVTSIPGLRLMAWLLGIVLLLTILGWALGSR